MGLKDIMLNMTFIALFVVALATYALNFANENGSIPITNNTAAGTAITSLEGNLSAFAPQTQQGYNAFSNSTPTTDFGGLALAPVTSVWKATVQIPIIYYNVLANLIFGEFFGDTVGNIIFWVINGLALALILLYAWKWIRIGDPD